eukprot:COSAG02_NODE_40783_length_401_cov_1.185430_1_plen_40_part_01
MQLAQQIYICYRQPTELVGGPLPRHRKDVGFFHLESARAW